MNCVIFKGSVASHHYRRKFLLIYQVIIKMYLSLQIHMFSLLLQFAHNSIKYLKFLVFVFLHLFLTCSAPHPIVDSLLLFLIKPFLFCFLFNSRLESSFLWMQQRKACTWRTRVWLWEIPIKDSFVYRFNV